MADLAAGDLTYTVSNTRRLGDSRTFNRVVIAFGDGALTVPANGIPITKAKCGCPNVIESMIVVDQGTSGYKFQYDQSAEKLVVMQAPAQSHTHNLFLRDNAVGADAAASRVNAGTNQLGANTGTNIVVAGNSATGGINTATLAAAALAEASAVAIAAQTIEVEVIGW